MVYLLGPFQIWVGFFFLLGPNFFGYFFFGQKKKNPNLCWALVFSRGKKAGSFPLNQSNTPGGEHFLFFLFFFFWKLGTILFFPEITKFFFSRGGPFSPDRKNLRGGNLGGGVTYFFSGCFFLSFSFLL